MNGHEIPFDTERTMNNIVIKIGKQIPDMYYLIVESKNYSKFFKLNSL
jgi:hypothetical protein